MAYAVDLVLLFFAYSLLGWCIEVTLKYRQFHRFINRGFFTGPILPIYGTGAALITVVVGGLSPLESGYSKIDYMMMVARLHGYIEIHRIVHSK